MIRKPNKTEYDPYFGRYIDRVPDGDIINIFRESKDKLLMLMDSVSEEELNFRYDVGKWSLKESLVHISDTERVFQYRALRISRGDQSPLAGFDQDLFIKNSNFDHLSKGDVINDYRQVSESSLALMKNMKEEDSERVGVFSGREGTPRAILYIMTGHIIHHLDIINERYL